MTRHGQLVADWVEVFAPVLCEHHRPLAWPAAGSLVLDDLPFSVRDPATGRFRIAFRIFCAAGFEGARPKLWRVEAFPDASQASWEAFLRALEGAPPRVVCDNHHGLNGAVRAVFPEAELYPCEWHLRHAPERLMAKIRKSDEHRAATDTLLPRVAAAFTGPAFWKPFVRDARAAENPRLSSWPDGAGRVVEEQFGRRGLRSQRPADMPLLTSAMDGIVEPMRAALHPRRYGLKNRERTNRLLALMQLHANRQDEGSPTPRTSGRGWKRTTAVRAFRAAPLTLLTLTSQTAPLEATGGADPSQDAGRGQGRCPRASALRASPSKASTTPPLVRV